MQTLDGIGRVVLNFVSCNVMCFWLENAYTRLFWGVIWVKMGENGNFAVLSF